MGEKGYVFLISLCQQFGLNEVFHFCGPNKIIRKFYPLLSSASQIAPQPTGLFSLKFKF